MTKIEFSVTLNMSLDLNGQLAKVSIRNVHLNPAVITLPVRLSIEGSELEREPEKKKTIHAIVKETARRFVAETGKVEFTAAELFHLAKKDYPNLKRNSFGVHVIEAAPNHNSWKHYPNKKDYLYYLGNGRYRLTEGRLNEDER